MRHSHNECIGVQVEHRVDVSIALVYYVADSLGEQLAIDAGQRVWNCVV